MEKSLDFSAAVKASDHQLKPDELKYYCSLAKSNVLKAVALEIFGCSLIWGGLAFSSVLLTAETYRLIGGAARPEPSELLMIKASLIALGGYVAFEAFVLLMKSFYHFKWLSDYKLNNEKVNVASSTLPRNAYNG